MMMNLPLILLALATNIRFTQALHKEIAPGVYTVDSQRFFISMFIVSSEGVIAIEPADEHNAKLVVEAIRNVTSKPIKYLFISHNHWDHSSGGKIFKDAGATVVAHEETYEYLKYFKGPETYIPDEYWEGSQKDYTLGNVTLQLYHFGKSHGQGMTIFIYKQQKIAYIADMGLPKQLIFLSMPDYNIKGALHTMEEITKLDFNRAIFAHQTGLDGGTKQDSIETFEYLTDLIKGVDDMIANGTNSFVIPTLLKLPKYANWTNYNDWFEHNVWRVTLDRLMGPWEYPPPKEKNSSSSLHVCNSLIFVFVLFKLFIMTF